MMFIPATGSKQENLLCQMSFSLSVSAPISLTHTLSQSFSIFLTGYTFIIIFPVWLWSRQESLLPVLNTFAIPQHNSVWCAISINKHSLNEQTSDLNWASKTFLPAGGCSRNVKSFSLIYPAFNVCMHYFALGHWKNKSFLHLKFAINIWTIVYF